MKALLVQGSASHLPLRDASVQCVVTSPPYWGLRKYAGEQREVWGGDGECAHEWGGERRVAMTPHHLDEPAASTRGGGHKKASMDASTGAFCACGAWYGALGLEPTPEAYVAHIVEVFREVRRVLRPDGTLWLNLGDSYSSGGRETQVAPTIRAKGHDEASGKQAYLNNFAVRPGRVEGLKPKDLVGIPWMVAFALRSDGWYLRSDIIWAKPNPMPESVTDRPTKSHEYLFLLTKSQRYFYDADAIREPHAEPWRGQGEHESNNPHSGRLDTDEQAAFTVGTRQYNALGRNKRTVWTIATQPYGGAHFATFPEALVEPCVLAGSSAQACGVCGAPWARRRMVSRATFERTDDPTPLTGRKGMNRERPSMSDRYILDLPQHEVAAMLSAAAAGREPEMRERFGSKWDHWTRTDASGARVPTFEDAVMLRDLIGVEIPFGDKATGWRATCAHSDGTGASVVLDPFVGSGTVAQVAVAHGRRAVGVDMSVDYLLLARARAALPLRSQKRKPQKRTPFVPAQAAMGALA